MEFAKRIKQVKTSARKLAHLEMTVIGQTAWQSTTDRDIAVSAVTGAYDCTCQTLDIISKSDATKAQTQEAESAIKTAMVDIVELIVSRTHAPTNRISKLTGLQKQRIERKSEIAAVEDIAEPADYLKTAIRLTKLAKSAVKQVAKLASDPIKYYDIAQKVWNKQIYRVAKANHIPVLKNMKMAETESFINLLKTNKVNLEGFRALSVVAGVVFTTLLISTVVLETLADSHNWASKLPGTLLVAGGTIFLSELVVTGPAIASLLASVTSSCATLAATTAEIPPVALAILAAGVVVVAGIGIAALYDFMVDTIFGPSEIPDNLRVQLSHPMTHQLSHTMQNPLFHEMG